MPDRRRLSVLPAAACLAALLAPAAASAEPDWSNPPPISDVRDVTPIPGASKAAPLTLPKPGVGFGFNGTPACDGNTPGGKVDRGLSCDKMRDLLDGTHATLTRTSISWRDIEPQPDQYDAGAIERLRHRLDATADSRRKAIGVLGTPPLWASQMPDSQASAPWNNDGIDAHYRRYVRHVVQELGTRLAAIEVWNEPNMHGKYFGWYQQGGGVSIPHYTRLVTMAAAEAHAVRPDLPVIVGGLLTADRDGPSSIGTERFLKEMYKEGLRPRWADPVAGYDGIGIHLYPRQISGHADPPDHQDFGLQTALNLLSRGYSWADPTAQIWVTETGVTTSGCQIHLGRCVYPGAGCGGLLQPKCDPYQRYGVSTWEQAQRLDEMLRYLHSVPRVRAVIVHSLTDSGGADGGNSPMAREFGFGVLATPNFGVYSVKPAYCRIQSMTVEPLRSDCPAGSATAGAHAASAPLPAVPPRLTGLPRAGRSLTSSNGTWDGWPRATVTLQWLRCDAAGQSCVMITGATGATYAVKSTDIGHRLRVRATATNEHGSAMSNSAATPAIIADQPPVAALTSSTSPIYAGRPASFSAAGSSDPEGDALTFRWPDGGTGPNRTISLPTPGTVTLWVDVSDGVNTVRRALALTVLDPGHPPVIRIAPLPRIVKNRPFTIDAATYSSDPDGDAIVSWQWDFDGNGTWDRVTTTGIITHSYPTTGPRSLRVRGTDARGLWGEHAVPLTVQLL